jgi:hypothetical protein
MSSSEKKQFSREAAKFAKAFQCVIDDEPIACQVSGHTHPSNCFSSRLRVNNSRI